MLFGFFDETVNYIVELLVGVVGVVTRTVSGLVHVYHVDFVKLVNPFLLLAYLSDLLRKHEHLVHLLEYVHYV